ncbi:FAD-binding dehydrogenase [Corynebacterium sp. TAE3-ERU12]|uniref:FAD-binding dehydrogenase n=1 Tax=Corynebacterium sp. TAE3-ERU12 TaxID=2849491 RepID=UPI001C497C6E|nr:FAD-binding dehydrogenase [Corynebacterium sp. TAE3-ERU12]MBV7295499.1 FAD-binding dehydrogenase [Corynebacterium sp. TAE3-ERU12]
MDTKQQSVSEVTAQEYFDVIVVGAGLAGLVAAYEAQKAGRRVLIVDQESFRNRGGQAFWSLGGIFLIDSPEQRRLGVKDSLELARHDWFCSAQFDRPEDHWPRQWAEEYLKFAAGEKREYLTGLGMRFLPVVGWAERGEGDADGHGNSVPRFHLTWGTGPEIVRVFLEPLEEAEKEGRVVFAHRHRVDEVTMESGRVTGVKGTVLERCDHLDRGMASPKGELGPFEFRGDTVLIATGGVGGNLDMVRRYWPEEKLGPMPTDMVTGVPAHVDGRGIEIAERAGAHTINRDRMWHYTEGMANWDPIWPNHGIRIIPGPSSLWFDATGKRLPAPYIPGADTVGTMKAILDTGYSYSWFVLNESIVSKEFLFSGSEQNPDLTDKELTKLVDKIRAGIPGPVQAFMDKGEDWVIADTLEELVDGMNAITGADPESDTNEVPVVDAAQLRHQIEARDMQVDNNFSKDYQVNYTRVARKFLGDKLIRCVSPHKILDKKHGPLIAVRLRMLTRKTLGGIETDLEGRVLGADGQVVDGLWAAGEATGFGGGGMHGNNALEGTFLGGCVFSGMRAGRSMSQAVYHEARSAITAE